ncbi:MAG TPA: hypothetical protein VIW69_05360, partial [Candidatus Elarobacter sp.]
VQLLLWGVLCVSFDTYWQTTYRHVGGKPLEWLEMVVKYVTMGLGLGLLLYVCASFGDERGNRARATVRRWSLAIGAALTAVGLWHGVLYVQSCYFFYPGRDQCIISEQALFAVDAYLVVDALLRSTIIVVAAIGYVRASPDYKQRTMLVTSSSVVFALGTVVDFLARLQVGYDVAAFLQVADAVTTVVFPLGLLYAATRRRLFDVEYVVKRSVSYTIATVIVLGLWGATVAIMEASFHEGALAGTGSALAITAVFFRRAQGAAAWAWSLIRTRRNTMILIVAGVVIAALELTLHESVSVLAAAVLRNLQKSEFENQLLFKYAVGIPFLLCWKLIADKMDGRVERLIMPERHKLRSRLPAFIAQIPFVTTLADLKELLRRALHTATHATFADIYWHNGQDIYDRYLSSTRRDPAPHYFPKTQPPIPRLARHRHICLRCGDKGVPEGDLMFPMRVKGQLSGIMLCGPPKSAEKRDFAHDEKADLANFAVAAGNALVLHGATVDPPTRKETS